MLLPILGGSIFAYPVKDLVTIYTNLLNWYARHSNKSLHVVTLDSDISRRILDNLDKRYFNNECHSFKPFPKNIKMSKRDNIRNIT